MAQVLVRDLGATIVEKLPARAKAHERSLEAELRDILHLEAVRADKADALGSR